MASSEVGTVTSRTPRSQVAATKPARSVVDPPPSPTTASERVNPAEPSTDQQRAATCAVLAASASGTSIRTGSMPASLSACTTRSAASIIVGGCSTATCWTPSPTSAGIRSCSR